MVDDASEAGKYRTNSEIRRWYLERITTIVELNQTWISVGSPRVTEPSELVAFDAKDAAPPAL